MYLTRVWKSMILALITLIRYALHIIGVALIVMNTGIIHQFLMESRNMKILVTTQMLMMDVRLQIHVFIIIPIQEMVWRKC